MGLRYMGFLLLPLCGWLAGDAYRQQSVTHLKDLQTTITLFQRIRQEIEFRRTDFSVLYRILCEEGTLKNQSRSSSLQEILPPSSFSEEERRCFAECMQGLGRVCAEQEEQQLDYYVARFESFQKQSERLADAQAGLPHKLGFAAGAMLALVFL